MIHAVYLTEERIRYLIHYLSTVAIRDMTGPEQERMVRIINALCDALLEHPVA